MPRADWISVPWFGPGQPASSCSKRSRAAGRGGAIAARRIGWRSAIAARLSRSPRLRATRISRCTPAADRHLADVGVFMNPDRDQELWRDGDIECVMASCCSGAELQLLRGGEILLRELYPSKSDLYERA